MKSYFMWHGRLARGGYGKGSWARRPCHIPLSAQHSLLSTLLAILLLAATCKASETASTAKAPAKADPFADNACIQCHRDLPGRSSEIVELEWKLSVHHAAGVTCDGCHGGNPAVKRDHFPSDEAFKKAAHLERNPEFLLMHQDKEFASAGRGRSVSYFCGKCHAKIKEQHLGSPHGEFGDPTCLFCHGQGSHKITHPTPEIIDTRARTETGRCSPCHRSGTMKAVARIKNILTETEEHIQASGKLYSQLEAWGYRNLELEKLHHHAKEINSQLRQIFHSFNMRDINNFAGEIQATVERTTATYELVQRLRQSQRQQTAVGAGAVLLLLSFAALLIYYKHSFLEHEATRQTTSDASSISYDREVEKREIPNPEK
jgi:hypothetical protein